MKLAFLATLSAFVASSSAKQLLRTNEQMYLNLGEHMEMEVSEKSQFQGASLVQDENHGLCFMGKWSYESNPVDIKNAEGKKVAGRPAETEIEFGVTFEPFVTPFVKLTYKFARSLTEMFPKAWEKTKTAISALANLPKIKAAVAKAKSFKELAKSISTFAKDKWAVVKKKMPSLARLLEMLGGFKPDAAIGGYNTGNAGTEKQVPTTYDDKGNPTSDAASNGGFTVNVKPIDGSNGGRPVIEIEWRLKDGNSLTSCCLDIVGPLPPPKVYPSIAGGTCGFSNQGLHAQLQLGNVNLLKLIFGVILPEGKNDVQKAPYKVKGKFVISEIKKGVATNFDITAAAKAVPKYGGKFAAAKMQAGKSLVKFANALMQALKSSTLTLRLEFRFFAFTVGVENKMEVGCNFCKLGGGTGCKKSDGKTC